MEGNFSYQQRQKELHKELTKYYDKRYGYEFSMLFQKFWNKEILDLCPMLNDTTVIDFGCGTGILFPVCSKRYNSIVGVDLSYEMITKAPRNMSQIKGCVVGDGCYLPFTNDCVTLVICRSALHHLPDLDQTLLEIRRILKKDGVFVFSEPSNDNYLIRLTRFLMYRLSTRFDEKDKAFITDKLKQRLIQLGFHVDTVKRFGYLSYLFSGFPDHFPIMKYIPFSVSITRFLIFIDKLLAKVPVIKNQSFHAIFKTKKVDQSI